MNKDEIIKILKDNSFFMRRKEEWEDIWGIKGIDFEKIANEIHKLYTKR